MRDPRLTRPQRTRGVLLLLATLSPLSACSKDGVEELSGTLDISTLELDFGDLPIGEEDTQEVVVTNGTDEVKEILSVSLVEGATTTWDVDRDAGTSELQPGEEAIITVLFAPVEVGEDEGRLQVRTSDADTATAYVSLRGVGTASTADNDGDGVSVADGDCDDGDAAVYPGAEEICDGKDNNCDGALSSDEADDDYDGFRLCSGDCDDDDNRVYPGAREVCDGKDNDCDGVPTEDADLDDDGFSICDDDCDDADPLAWPGNPEECDFIDNDCSGFVDDIDNDLDGFSPCALGGDCDDNDPDAYPVVVDNSELEEGDGTAESPFITIDTAMANLDEICRTIVLLPGTYPLHLDWDEGDIQFNGAGASPGGVTLTPPEVVGEDGTTSYDDRIFNVENNATLRLQNLTLQSGNATTDGGLIRALDADVLLSYVNLRNSRTGGDGGAVAVSSGRLEMEGCTFRGNTALDDGGAIAVVSSVLIDDGSTLIDNRGTRGGAILAESTNLSLTDTTIQDNAGTEDGGGITMIGGSGLWMERVRVWSNGAGRGGGGVSLADVNIDGGVIRNSWFQDNYATQRGGGLQISGGSAQVILANNTFAANASLAGSGDDDGAAIYVSTEDNEDLYIWSNIFAWNEGRNALSVPAGSGASVAYNTAEFTTGGVEFDIGAGEDVGNNVEEDPQFTNWDTSAADPSGYDLSLQGTSPARDNGPVDGEGPPGYLTWSDLDASRNDRGMTGGPGATP